MDDSILAAFMRDTAHMVVVIGPQGVIEWVNPAFESATGYTLAEACGRRAYELLRGPETDAAAIEALFRATSAGLPVRGLQIANYRRDGTLCWVELELLPLRDVAGQVLHYVALQQDITALKLERERHRRSEQLLHEAAQIAHIGAWDVDADTGELRWTDETYAIHELPPGTPIDVEFALTFYTPESLPRIRAAVDRALQEGEPYDLEVEFITSRGHRRWARAVGNAQRRDGRVVRIAGTFQDITELRQTREQFAEMAERLRLATEASGIGVWERMLPDGLVTWNEHMFRLFGLTPQAAQVTAKQWEERIHPDDRARVLDMRHRLREGSMQAFETEYRIVLPSGELRHIRSIGRRVDTTAGQAKLIGTVIDITELKRSEQSRMEKEAAERASRAKSEFLSRVSHELRTPLNGVLGFAQLLALDADTLSASQREQVGYLKRAGEHLLQIVNDMLDLASIEAGALRLSLEPLALGELVDDAVALLRPMAADRGITMECTAPAGAAVWVQADRTRLKQVLMNLLSNAVKYNRLRGSVHIEWRQEAGEARLTVSDSGRGLAPQELAQLFQPFNRLGAEGTPVRGTGLGLSITRRLMEAMGGRIDASSTLGVGTQFHLALALAQPPEPAALSVNGSSAAAAASRPRLLFYVEDNPVNVLLMQQALALHGASYRLEVAHDGEQALARLATLRPDLLLLDINLPGISGYEVLRRLDGVLGSERPPCVAVSADAMPEELARAREAGFDDYWTKPLDLAGLRERIEALLLRRRSNAAPPPAPALNGSSE